MAKEPNNEPAKRIVRAAAVQAEPVWFDLAATVTKTCTLIESAAAQGAHIVAFPELWLPGYPTWIWARAMDPSMNVRYAKNAVQLPSPLSSSSSPAAAAAAADDSQSPLQRIQSCAAEHHIVVCLGCAERAQNGSLYIGQCTIDSDGRLAMRRRKMKPFHVERTLFGDGDGPSLENVVDTAVGSVGQLSCGEHFNPLLTFSTYSQGEEIHVAAWPAVPADMGPPAPYSLCDEAVASISQVYSIQAQCFTLHSTTVISAGSITAMGTGQAPVFNAPGGGNARIFAPDGRQVTTDLPKTEEGMVLADLDMDLVLQEKAILDSAGHMGRPELVWLGKNTAEQKHVRTAGAERGSV